MSDLKWQATDLIQANVAGFRGRKESIDFNVDFSVLLGFVFQHF
jgi:hypothetical protein